MSLVGILQLRRNKSSIFQNKGTAPFRLLKAEVHVLDRVRADKHDVALQNIEFVSSRNNTKCSIYSESIVLVHVVRVDKEDDEC
jgi:hypothetical protein